MKQKKTKKNKKMRGGSSSKNVENANFNLLHLFSFKTPPLGAVMSGEGVADFASLMRNGVKLCEELCIMKVQTLCYYAKIAKEQLVDDKINPNHRVFIICFLNYFNALLDFLLAIGIITNEEMMEIKGKYTMYGGAGARMTVNRITKYLIIFIGSCLIQLSSGFTNINKFYTQDFGRGEELRHLYAQNEWGSCTLITSAYWMFYANQENIMPLFRDIYSGPIHSNNIIGIQPSMPESLFQPKNPPILEGYKDINLGIHQFDVHIAKPSNVATKFLNSVQRKMNMKQIIVPSIDRIDEYLKEKIMQEFKLIEHKKNDFYIMVMGGTSHVWLLFVSPKVVHKEIIDFEICVFEPQNMVNMGNYFFTTTKYYSVKPRFSNYCTPGFPKFPGINSVKTNTPVLEYFKSILNNNDDEFVFSRPVKMAENDESKDPKHFLNFLKLFQTDYVHKGIENSVKGLEKFSKQPNLPPLTQKFTNTLFEQQQLFFDAYTETYLDLDPFAHTYKDSKFNEWKKYKRPANTPLLTIDEKYGLSNFYINSQETPILDYDQFFVNSKPKKTTGTKKRKSKPPKDNEF